MNDVQLLVTDIDGTIMPEGSLQLDAQYLELIEQLVAAGYHVVIASGRQTESIERLFAPVLQHISIIGNGGLSISTARGKQLLDCIPRPWIEELEQDIAALPTVDGLFCGLGVSYAYERDSEMARRLIEEYCINLEVVPGLGQLPDIPLGKVSLFRERDLEQYVNETFVPKWKDRLSLTMAGDYWLDCVMPGVGKATALQLILDELGISPAHVLASGDQMNDYEMLRLAGHSIAVSNARPELQVVADEVHENADFLAVARAWRALL